MAHIIKLNVGGSLFQTSKSTLTKFDGFFKTMLETEIPVAKDESGAIFIDRDPKHFRVILNFMRDGDVALPEAPVDVTEIQKEAEYYLLGGLVELCKPKLEAQKMPYFAETYEDMARAVSTTIMKTQQKLRDTEKRSGGGFQRMSRKRIRYGFAYGPYTIPISSAREWRRIRNGLFANHLCFQQKH
ncbi:Protein CBG25769 [Caenorhabditis briggsae]|uniref:Protein CBG25769 n=1 Tax=Caenorhabditis briggsae TaxID=6238 RepID=B6IE81_CAEBR|nr:Protein CBG25769 [Caenorhabditis briggsae]CAS01145.1 Protein CBG25769 [Caenorhabditis briggsae]